ncbi:MAG: hypothetical protein HQL27_06860, partial [Candidatus Omnitrophica bacterium]|nr:hypothetical protein [Candidatus Omnitrophota bacterium]
MKKIQIIFILPIIVALTSLSFAQGLSDEYPLNSEGISEEALEFSEDAQEFTEEPAEQFSVAEAKTVKAIDIQGNKTISLTTILTRIKTRVGQDYLDTVISDDIKRLYNTGYFSDVKIDRQDHEGGVKVIIILEEKPIVEEVTFSKIKNLTVNSIKSKIKTKSGMFLDRKDLKDDIGTIKELYAKKGLTDVQVEIETFVDEVTNKATLHFVIREGNKVRIAKVNILGNNTFKDSKISKVIKTRPKGIFRSGYLKDEVIKEDVERIISF